MMNPEMMRMAMEQMRNMTPEQMQQMQQMAANMDPAQMAQMQQAVGGMDPAQMRQMQQAAGGTGGIGGGMGGRAQPPAPAAPQQISTLAQATALKEAGNRLHTSGSYQGAVAKYQEARRKLGTDDSTPEGRALAKACLLNLASCALKLQRHGDCVAHCNDVLETEPNNVKALYRRGQALLAQDKAETAVPDLKTAIRLSPPDDQAVMREVLEKARAQLPPGSVQADTGDDAVTIEDITASAGAPTAPAAAPSTPPLPRQPAMGGMPSMPPGGFSEAQMRQMGEMMSNPHMSATMESMISGMSQEQLDAMAAASGQPRVTKDQACANFAAMKGLGPDQLAAMARSNFTPGQAASPDHLRRAAEMLQANPEMMQQSLDMMKHMSAEDMAAAARAVGAPPGALTPDSLSSIQDNMRNMTPEQLQETAHVAAAAHASQAGSAAPPRPAAASQAAPPPAADTRASFAADNDAVDEVEPVAAPSASGAAAATPAGARDMAGMFSPEMMQMASSMMANMAPEDMARMSQMAGGMGAPGGPPGPGGMPQVSPEIMKNLNSPEMTEMLQRMMKTMDPEQLSGMMKQSGMDVSPEQAAMMKTQMERLSPRQMQWLMSGAVGVQRSIEAAKRAKAYLAARPLMAAALAVLLLAVLLRLCGWV